MKSLILLSVWFGSIVLCQADEVLAEYDWQKLSKSGGLFGGAPVNADGKSALLIRNTNSTPLRVQLLEIKSPKISKNVYAVIGEIRYESVRGDGYLEMWNYYPPIKPGSPEGQYFSRTLGVSGKMGKITGTSNWRPFMLAFDRTGSSGPPTRLELNLFLPGSGTVSIGPLNLIEYPAGASLTSVAAPATWWSNRAAGLIGGIGGAALGCLGSLVAWLASNGRARSFVIATLQSLIVLGGIVATAAVAALVLRQPYAVWFPLVLGSALLLGILPPRLGQYRRQYEAMELRKMASVDALG